MVKFNKTEKIRKKVWTKIFGYVMITSLQKQYAKRTNNYHIKKVRNNRK